MDYSGREEKKKKKKSFQAFFSGDISSDQTESFEFLQSYIQLSKISYFHLFYLVSCFIYTFHSYSLCLYHSQEILAYTFWFSIYFLGNLG